MTCNMFALVNKNEIFSAVLSFSPSQVQTKQRKAPRCWRRWLDCEWIKLRKIVVPSKLAFSLSLSESFFNERFNSSLRLLNSIIEEWFSSRSGDLMSIIRWKVMRRLCNRDSEFFNKKNFLKASCQFTQNTTKASNIPHFNYHWHHFQFSP